MELLFAPAAYNLPKNKKARSENSPRCVYFKSGLGQSNLYALFEGHDCLLPVVRPASLRGALTAGFAAHVQRVHLRDLDLEQLLNRLADLGLVRARISHNRILVEVLALAR